MELRFKGSINKDEYLHLVTLINHPAGRNDWTVDLWVVLVALGAMIVAASACTMASGMPVAGGGFVIGILLVGLGLSAGRGVHQMWANNEALRIEREGTITGEQIELRTRYSQSRYQWADFAGYGEYQDIIYLSLRGEGLAFSPRFFASSADWDAFCTLVHGKLPVSHEVKRFSWRWFLPDTSPQRAYVFILILLAAIVIFATSIQIFR
jgi:hypothetical protein